MMGTGTGTGSWPASAHDLCPPGLHLGARALGFETTPLRGARWPGGLPHGRHLRGAGDGCFLDNRTLATATGGSVRLWDLATHKARLTLAHPVRLYALAPDGRSLATCDAKDNVMVMRVEKTCVRERNQGPRYG